MKNISEFNLHLLSEEDQINISGGSEFSEDFVHAIGWFFGAGAALAKSMAKSFIENQARVYERGLNPVVE